MIPVPGIFEVLVLMEYSVVCFSKKFPHTFTLGPHETETMDTILVIRLLLSAPATAFQEVNHTRVGWVSEPEGCGTFSILLANSLAMGLCV
jgi:hypothetical protein